MKLLKPGDPCPCCGQPIKSRDPEVLARLTRIREQRYFPTVEELRAILGKRGEADAQ